MDIVYPIESFVYDKDRRIFSGYKELLYPIHRNCGEMPFPNGRSKFYIVNSKTQNKVRFIFVHENVKCLLFQTESDYVPKILCTINKIRKIEN